MIRPAWSCLAALAAFSSFTYATTGVAHAQDCACEAPWSLPSLPRAPVPEAAPRGVGPDAGPLDAGPLDAAVPDAATVMADAAPVVPDAAGPTPDGGGGVPPGPRLMPTNGRIFIQWPGVADDALTLGIDGGGGIDFTVEPASDLPDQRWVVPVGPLPPGQTVVLTGGTYTLRFDVGPDEDQTPPVVRGIESQGAILRGDCAPHVAAELRALGLQAPDDLDDVLYEVDLRRLGPPPEERIKLLLPSWMPLVGAMRTDDPAQATCLANVSFALTSWDYLASVRVIDVAGNAADHATREDGSQGALLETEFRFADNPARGCGCRVGGASERDPSGGAIAVGLTLIGAVLVGVRRRPSTRPRG